MAADIAPGGILWDIVVQGNYAYIVKLVSGPDYLLAIDISAPTTPFSVDSISIEGSLRSLYVQGNYAYIANNQFGSLEIVDISHVGSSPPSAVVVNDNGELFLSPLFDNLGNHIANQNIALSNNWLSNDGSDEGISISGVGNVGIGTDAVSYTHLRAHET